MPPKNIPQRRSRKETLQEDLTKLVFEENMNDEEVLPILKEALNEGVDVNLLVNDQTLICYFAFFGMLKCFEECFAGGADPTIVTSQFPSDALVSAVEGFAPAETSLRMVKFLLKHLQVNDLDHQNALFWACPRGQFEVVRLYLRWNVSFADRVLWLGVEFRSMQLVEIALEFHAEVNQLSTYDDQYLIHMAAEFEDSSILQKLLDAGADIEAKNKADETPFDVAVRFNSVGCVKLLIDKKFDFCIHCALSLAVRCRSDDVLKELLKSEEFREAEGPSLHFMLAVVASNDLEAFRIVYPLSGCLSVISQLVRFQKYDMLSAALFEFWHPGLSTQYLTELITEAPNDAFKTLLQRKIDVMNGVDSVVKVKKEAEVDLVVKVKKEAEEEEQQQQQQQQNEEEEEEEEDDNEK